MIAGPQRRTRVMNDKEKLITAYHEGGHALAAAAMNNTDPVTKVTILPRGQALGYTMVLPLEDKYSVTRNELLDQLAYAMGGRVAEEIVFHDPTTGASNDIEKATAIARKMVTEYGMSDEVGPVKLGSVAAARSSSAATWATAATSPSELAETHRRRGARAHRAGARRGLAGAQRQPRHPRPARARAAREGDARPHRARRDLQGRRASSPSARSGSRATSARSATCPPSRFPTQGADRPGRRRRRRRVGRRGREAAAAPPDRASAPRDRVRVGPWPWRSIRAHRRALVARAARGDRRGSRRARACGDAAARRRGYAEFFAGRRRGSARRTSRDTIAVARGPAPETQPPAR